MKRKWLIFYLANWYAFAVGGLLLSQQDHPGNWLAHLPWTSWGTELAAGLEGEAVSGGALWILMGTALALTGVIGSILACIIWLAGQAQAQERGQGQEKAPAVLPAQGQSFVPPAGSLSQQSLQASALVDDPQLRALIQRLDARLG